MLAVIKSGFNRVSFFGERKNARKDNTEANTT